MSRGWRAEVTRYGAPVAFLAAVTLAVLLVRSGLNTKSAPAPDAVLPAQDGGDAQRRRHSVRHHGLGAPRAQPGNQGQRPHRGPADSRALASGRMRLVLVAAALALAAPVLAAPPPQVNGHSWLVENGTSGEVLLSHDANQRVAIASITK